MPSILDALNDKFGTNGGNIADSISQITKGSGGEGSGSGSATPSQPMASAVFFIIASSPEEEENFLLPALMDTQLAALNDYMAQADSSELSITCRLSIGENISQAELDTLKNAAQFYQEHGYGAIESLEGTCSIQQAFYEDFGEYISWSITFTGGIQLPGSGSPIRTEYAIISTYNSKDGVSYDLVITMSAPAPSAPIGGES